MVRLTDRPDMTLDATVDVKQQCNNNNKAINVTALIANTVFFKILSRSINIDSEYGLF